MKAPLIHGVLSLLLSVLSSVSVFGVSFFVVSFVDTTGASVALGADVAAGVGVGAFTVFCDDGVGAG